MLPIIAVDMLRKTQMVTSQGARRNVRHNRSRVATTMSTDFVSGNLLKLNRCRLERNSDAIRKSRFPLEQPNARSHNLTCHIFKAEDRGRKATQ